MYAFHHGGAATVRSTVIQTSWVYFGMLSCICVVYAVAGDWLYELADGRRHPDAMLVTLILGISTLATSLALAATNGLSAIDRPQSNLWIEGLTFAATAVSAMPLTNAFGLVGAAVAMLIGNCVGAVVAFVAFEWELRRLGGDWRQGLLTNAPLASVRAQERRAGEGAPLISVIVTTFNRSAALGRALTSLAAQQTGGEFDFEIVVVDNGSADDTRRVADQHAGGTSAASHYFYEPKQGLPFARNRGLREAHGDWIAFFDDDQLAPPEWLGTLWRFAGAQLAACVGGGRKLVIDVDTPPQLAPYCRKLLGEVCQNDAPARYGRKFLPTTGNSLVHRSVFEALGGFNESWLEGGEDTEFFNRLVRSGIDAWFTPEAVVKHVIPPNRLTPQYLERIGLRHGVTFGRRDFEERGRWLLPFFTAARLVHGLVMFGSPLMLAKLRGDRAAELGWRCRLRRVEGYCRFALQAIAPRAFRQEEFVSQMIHRDARPDVALRSRTSPVRPMPRIEPVEKAS
jgi:glycosyltransferase involved in cell wall biosynthesis